MKLPSLGPAASSAPLLAAALGLLLAAPAQGRDPRGGITVQTRHYAVWTDAGEEVGERVGRELEGMWQAYARLLGRAPRLRRRLLRVRVFAAKERASAYCEEAHGEPTDSFRYYHYGLTDRENEFVGWLLHDAPFSARLRHEGFHQFFRALIDAPPQWLNEGLAEVVEASRVTADGELELRLNPFLRRLREGILEVDRGPLNGRYPLLDLEDLVTRSKGEWLADRGSAYAQSWGLCYYLVREAPRSLRERLQAYVLSLEPAASRARNTKRAFALAFRGLDFDRLQDAWADWVEATKMPGWDAFERGHARLDAEDWEGAAAAFDAAVEADPEHYRYLYFRGYARYLASRLAGAEADLAAAIARFPEYTSAHYIRGKVLLRLDRPEDARASLERAVEHGMDEEKVAPWLGKAEAASR